MSVFLHADARGDLSEALEPEKRPLPLSSALKLIQDLPQEQVDAAKEIAGCKLANAILVENKQEFEPHFQELMGIDSQEFKRLLHGAIPTPPTDTPWMNYDLLRQVFYGGLAGDLIPGLSTQRERLSRAQAVAPAPPPTPAPTARSARSQALQDLEACFGEQAESQPGNGPESKLNLTSLVTTVDIPSTSNCDFATLARILDPRSWSLSPFWPESYEVRRSENGREFAPPEKASSDNGESWRGYLFEHVEWNWNVSTVASFRNYLDIKYVVDEASQRLRLDFALYSCEGSQLYLLEQRQRGIDVDSGFQCVAPLVQSGNTPAEKRMTVRDMARRDDPNFDRNFQRQIAQTGPAIRQGMRAMSEALPAMMQGLTQAQHALERAAANMPDPTYPKR